MTDVLVALADDRIVGAVRRSRSGRLTFVYDGDWRADGEAFPLSLSMPLVIAEHGHGRIEPWLWGLLPDNDVTLARWGQRFHVSPRNPFGLISAVGEDCAGAIQFVTPERVPKLLSSEHGVATRLTATHVAQRIALLRRDQSAWRLAGDTGQFSLAGAQAKTALLFDDGRWCVPSGRVPTTHILKPPIDGFDGHVVNEHMCLALARELGLPAARSQVCHFHDEVAVVVERYDRRREGDAIRRLHQEDLCQALALPPMRKYQNEGGPGVGAMLEVIRTHSSEPGEDAWTFIRACAFNWLIGGTDAHAKNYSVLIGAGGRVRLAPLYDVASAVIYDHVDVRKLKLATRIGGKYRLEHIELRQWEKFATEVRAPKHEVLAACRELARDLPQAVHAVAEQARRDGLDHPVIDRLNDVLSARAERCARVLAA